MPYYGESAYGGPGGSGYYSSGSSAGGGFANHSSLMSGVNRYFNPIAARYSPHLSTISETPSLLHLRRHHAQPTSTTLSALRPCRRIIDTADIDVSKPPRSLGSSQENHSRQQRHRLRRDRPTIKIRSQALKDNPALREYNEKHEKTVGELLVEKFLIKDKGAERKMRLYHQASLVRPTADDNSDALSKEKEDEILAAIARRVTRRMTRRRSSADIVPLDPEQIKREAALQAAQAEVLDTLVAEEQAEIECEVRRGTFAKRPVMRLPQEISEVSESEDDGDVTETEKKVHAITKKKKRRRSLDKPPPSQASDEENEEDGSDDIHDISESIIEEEEEEDFEWDDRKKCDDIRKVLPAEVDNKDDRTRTDKSEVGNHANVSDSSFIKKKQLDDKLRTVNSEIIILNKKEEPPVKSEIEQRLDQMNAKIKNLKKEVRETDRRENDKIIRKKTDTTDTLKTKDDDAVRGERTSKTLKRTKSAPQPPLDVTPGFKIEACNSVGDFSTLFIKAAGATSPSKVTEQFRESVRLPAPRASPPTEVVVLPVRKPYVRDTSRNSVYLALKPSQNIRTTVVTDDDTRKEDRTTTTSTTTITTATAAAATATLDESRPAKCDVIDRSIIENDDLSVGSVSRRSALGGGDEFVSWWDETPEEEETPKSGEVVCNSVVQQEPVVKQKLDKTIPTGNFKDKVKVAKSKVDAKTTADDKTKVPDTKIKSKVIVNGFKEDKDKIDDLAVSDKTELESSPKSKPLVNDLKEVKKASTVDDKLTTKVEAVTPKIAKKTNDLQDKPKVTVKESKDKEVKDKVDLTPNVVLEKDTKKNDLPQDKPKLLAGVPKEDKVEVCVKKSLEKGTASKDKSTVLSEISKEDKVKIEVLPEKKKPAVAPKPQVNKETCEVQSKAKPAPVDVSKDNKVETTLVSEKAESKIKLPEKEKSTENKVLDKVKVTGEVVPDEPKQAAVDTVDKNFKSVIVEIKDKPAEKLSETKINKVFEKPSEKFVTKTVDKKVPELEVKEKIISNKTTDIKEKVPENKLKETKEKALVKPVEIKDNKLTDDKVIAKTAVDAKDKISAKVNEVKDKVSEKVVPKPAESKVTSNKVIEIKDKVVPEAKVPVAEPKLKAPKEPRPISPNKKAKLAPSEELREKSVSPTNENKRKKSHNDLIIAEVPAVRPDRRHLPRIPEEQQAGVKPVATDDKSAAEPSLAAAPKKDKEDKKRKVDSEAVMMIEKKILEDAESPDMILTTALPQQETVANMKSAAVAAPEVTEIDFWSEIGLVPGAEKVQLRVDTEEDRKSLKLDFTQAPSAAPEEEEDEEKTPLISQPATPLVENLNEVPPANLKERSASVADELQQDERSATVKKITKWGNHDNLANIADTDADVTPLASKDVSPTASAASSTVTKKKIVKKKKSTTGKKSSEKGESTKSTTKKTTTKKKKASADSPQTSQLKTPMSAFGSPRNSPAQRPPELNKLFYTTPAILLTATPRDLRKVRRAKAKRKKPPTRTPSLSSDSTGSTRSTATTTSTEEGSNCEEDADHKRLASTRSNDSGFDGSPRLSNCDMVCHKKCEKLTGNLCGLNQKLVAEALQALKQKERERDKGPPVYARRGRKSFVRRRLRPYLNPYGYVDPLADLSDLTFETPSQSSENQRNADSDHFHNSGRITPPATNLPRFKKYEVTDFNFLKVLGKGSFGKVLLAELRGTDCVYAVKCLKKDVVLEDDDVECTLIERKVLTLATRHPYLCHLFCTFQTESHLFFVMEYLNGGDLMFHIQKSGRFSEARAKFYAAEIWSGLIFLHKKGIVYRDLKLDNVLLDFEGHIRIADFGMCKLQIFLDRTADTFCGTPDYMAPEIIKGLKYNQAVDWWSFGVLLYEMLTGQSPFSGCDEDELFWSICNERPFIPRYLSQSSTDILVCLLEKDAGKRIPGHEIACHPFFCTIAWDKLERRVLEAPFKPAVEHTLDTRYFDTAFTTERPRLTPVPEQILTSMDQAVFRGFSYTNPNATD